MTNPVTQNAYLVSNGTGTIFPTVIFNRAPTTNDINFPITQRWIDTSDRDSEWFLLGYTSTGGVVQANWVQLSAGGMTAETLTGNDSVVVPPTSGNINVVGDVASGIEFTGNAATSTLTGTLANIPNSSLQHDDITLVAGSGISISVSPVALGGSTTISAGTNVATTYVEDVGTATPSSNSLSIVGGTGVSTSGSGSTVTINLSPRPGLILISSNAVNTVSEVVINNLTNYNCLLVINVGPNTANSTFLLEVSTDNGSTFITTNYQSGLNYSPYNSASLTNINSSSNFVLSSAGPFNGYFNLSGLNGANNFLMVGNFDQQETVLGTTIFGTAGGECLVTGVNAIRIRASAGTFNGYVLLYGYVQ